MLCCRDIPDFALDLERHYSPPMRRSLHALFGLFVLTLPSCRWGLEDREPRGPHHGPPPGEPGEASAAPYRSDEPLYQVLYAGEGGDQAGQLGDQVRALAFLRALEPSADQTEGLRALIDLHSRLLEEDRRAREELDQRELTLIGPAYHQLLVLLAQPGPVPTERVEEIAREIQGARHRAGTDRFRDEHTRRIATHMQDIASWIGTLGPEQRARLIDCLFLLRRRLGPFTDPGDYGELVDPLWKAGDFGSLARTVRPQDEPPLDIGGLWSLEGATGRMEPTIRGLQLQALVFMALEEPALSEAIVLSQGVAVVAEEEPE